MRCLPTYVHDPHVTTSTSCNSKPLSLLLPQHRQLRCKLLQRQLARLLPTHDRLDDVGREEGEPHDPPDVGPINIRRPSQLAQSGHARIERRRLTLLKPLE